MLPTTLLSVIFVNFDNIDALESNFFYLKDGILFRLYKFICCMKTRYFYLSGEVEKV